MSTVADWQMEMGGKVEFLVIYFATRLTLCSCEEEDCLSVGETLPWVLLQGTGTPGKREESPPWPAQLKFIHLEMKPRALVSVSLWSLANSANSILTGKS